MSVELEKVSSVGNTNPSERCDLENVLSTDERMAELEEDELAADDSMDEDDSSYRYDPALVPSKLENGAE